MYRTLEQRISELIEINEDEMTFVEVEDHQQQKQKNSEDRRLTEFIDSTDKKDREWQKLLGHQEFEEVCRKELSRLSRKPNKSVFMRPKRI